MENSIYLNAKSLIRTESKRLKRENSDKGYIRYELNTLCDDLIRQFNFHALQDRISEKQAELYSNWLASYTASVHPNEKRT